MARNNTSENCTVADNLCKDDIPGATLDLKNVFRYTVSQLKFWLQCRGSSLKGCSTKAKCVERILSYKDNNLHHKVIDPTDDKRWVRLKRRKELEIGQSAPKSTAASSTVCSTVYSTSTPATSPSLTPSVQKGYYEPELSKYNWGKSLVDLPPITRKQIDDHRDKSGKRTEHQHDRPGEKSLKRGFQFHVEGFVDLQSMQTFRGANGTFMVRGKVAASLKKQIRHVSIGIAPVSAAIIFAHCTCPAGIGGFCNHIMAVLFKLATFYLYNLDCIPVRSACTSVERSWGVPPSIDTRKPMVIDMTVRKPKFDSSKSTKGTSCTLYNAVRNSSDVNVSEFKETFRSRDKGIGLAQTLQPPTNDTKYVDTRFGKVPFGSPLSYQLAPKEFDETVYCSVDCEMPASSRSSLDLYPDLPLCNLSGVPDIKQYLDSMSEHAKVTLESLKIDQANATKLEITTRRQRCSQTWFQEREHRLTASNAGIVCQRTKRTDFQKLANKLVNRVPLDLEPAIVRKRINHGITHEKDGACAYQTFMRRNGREVGLFEVGLVVNPSAFWLGATPDGRVTDPKAEPPFGLLEVKCPESRKMQDLRIAAANPSFYLEIFPCPKCSKDHLQLKKSHEYYTQCQMQMGLTGCQWLDFVVGTYKGISIQRVPFNKDYWNNVLQTATDFYFRYFLEASMK